MNSKVKVKIDGRPVEAVIVTDPWAEATRAFRRLGAVMARIRWLDMADE